MKKINIKICNLDQNDKTSYGYFILKTLKKYYDVKLSNKPDYIFYNESTNEYLKYNCIRIFYTGENISPNFNLCDYAIGFDYLNFNDRYYRLPLYLVNVFYHPDEIKQTGENFLENKITFDKQNLKNKKEFCSFVYSNYLSDGTRKLFFDKLNKYKKINSGGGYLNNIGYKVINKLEFEKKHKFSIAFENSSRDGYTTEKIVSSLVAQTIPIYWGNPKINKEFNEKRFINCHSFNDFDSVIEYIKKIDENDDLFLKVLNEPIQNDNYDFKKILNDFEKFLINIFNQQLNKTPRRTINPAHAKVLEKNEYIAAGYNRKYNKFVKIMATIYKPLKKIKIFEILKQKYLIQKNKND